MLPVLPHEFPFAEAMRIAGANMLCSVERTPKVIEGAEENAHIMMRPLVGDRLWV